MFILVKFKGYRSTQEKSPELESSSKNEVAKIDVITASGYRNIEQGGKRKFEDVDKNGEKGSVHEAKKQHKTEKKPNADVRFDYSLGHFPKIDKVRTVRCKNSKCNKKTFVYCSVCNVHLCICVNENRNCFEDFHLNNQ